PAVAGALGVGELPGHADRHRPVGAPVVDEDGHHGCARGTRRLCGIDLTRRKEEQEEETEGPGGMHVDRSLEQTTYLRCDRTAGPADTGAPRDRASVQGAVTLRGRSPGSEPPPPRPAPRRCTRTASCRPAGRARSRW